MGFDWNFKPFIIFFLIGLYAVIDFVLGIITTFVLSKPLELGEIMKNGIIPTIILTVIVALWARYIQNK